MRARNAPKAAPPLPTPVAAKDRPLALVTDPRKDEMASTASAEAPGGKCVLAGQSRDRKAVARALEWMQSRDAEVIDLRQENNRVVRNYSVYLPAFPTARLAAEKLAELRGRGVRDVAIIRKGARVNRISLGVFKSKHNMERRVAELDKLGYSAKWAANTRTLSEYAVRVRVGGARSVLASAWGSRFPGQPIETVDCP